MSTIVTSETSKSLPLFGLPAFCLTALVLSVPTSADVLWQDFSLTLLKGNDYRVDYADQQVITVEHAAGTTWGDSFFFIDHLRGGDDKRSNYAEWSPRLSASKISGNSYEFGIVKDVLLAGTVEMSSLKTNFLYGVGVDLAVPGFTYLQLNAYRRSNEFAADNWQLTTTWALPFKIGSEAFVYDGFMDWSSASNDSHASLNMTSQLKWALQQKFNLKSPLYLGVEYVHWTNKYGKADSPAFRTDESNVNLLLKWHF
jgi:nucleoside-specific outer membrane channel protein Tsx